MAEWLLHKPFLASDIEARDDTADFVVIKFSGGASVLSGGEIQVGGTEAQRDVGIEDTTDWYRYLSAFSLVGGTFLRRQAGRKAAHG